VAFAAVRRDGLALEFASKELRRDRELVLCAVAGCGLSIRWAAPELQRDPEVVFVAAEEDRRALHYVPEELWYGYVRDAEAASAKKFRTSSDPWDPLRWMPSLAGCLVGALVGPALAGPGLLASGVLSCFGGLACLLAGA